MAALAALQPQIKLAKELDYLKGIENGRQQWASSWVGFDTKEKIKGVAAVLFGTFAAVSGWMVGMAVIFEGARVFGGGIVVPLSLAFGIPFVGTLLFAASAVYAYHRFTLPTPEEVTSGIKSLEDQLQEIK